MDTNSQRQHAPGDKNRSFFLFQPRKSGGKGSPSVSLIGSQNQSRPVLTSSVCVPRLHTCGVAVFFLGISVSSGKSVWDAWSFFSAGVTGPFGNFKSLSSSRMSFATGMSTLGGAESEEPGRRRKTRTIVPWTQRGACFPNGCRTQPGTEFFQQDRNENVRSKRQCNDNRHEKEERTRSLCDCCNLTAPCAGPMKPGPL